MKTRISLPTLLPLLLGSALLGACGGEPAVRDDGGAAKDGPSTVAKVTETGDAAGGNGAGGMSPYLMTVYKSPTCSCCKKWVSYMQEEGFAVNAIDTDDGDAIRTEHGLEEGSLKSCHTAVIGGYVIEGHVPSVDVRRLLAERPDDVTGLTAPGMPLGSPGMGSREPKGYDVLAFDENGNARVWSSY